MVAGSGVVLAQPPMPGTDGPGRVLVPPVSVQAWVRRFRWSYVKHWVSVAPSLRQLETEVTSPAGL